MIRAASFAGLLAAALSSASAQECQSTDGYAIGLHGGAYTNGELITDEQLSFIRDLAASVNEDLAGGMDAVSAVEKAVQAMEASALYNAGRASITNMEGYVENDASIMSGKDLNAGSVGSLIDTKSPIKAARLVME